MKIISVLLCVYIWYVQGLLKPRWTLPFTLGHSQHLNSSNDNDSLNNMNADKFENTNKVVRDIDSNDNVEDYDSSTSDWYDLDDDLEDDNFHKVEGQVLEAYDPITDTLKLEVGHQPRNDHIDCCVDFPDTEPVNNDLSSNSFDISNFEADVISSNISNYNMYSIVCPVECRCVGTKLDCAGQNLTSVPEGISALTTWLDLSMNSLQELPENTFANMINLKELLCVGNNLTELPNQLFKHNKFLQLLNFQGNFFTKVPPHTFQNLRHLLELHLDANLISAIPDEAFVGLANLKQLWLDDNKIEHIPVLAFKELNGLQALTLIKNQLIDIPDFAFRNNTRLIQLRLADNQIQEIADEAFNGLTKLKYLQLQNNRISTMPSAFSNLLSLDELNLEGNRLTEIPDNSFKQKDKLTTLSLGNNPIASVRDASFTNLPSLQELKLSEVQYMTKFPDLAGTMNLTVLQLDRANIKSIPKEVCSNLKKLKTFDVHSNKIGIIPEMSQCKYLTILNMANNELTSVEGQLFNGMDHLKDLTLSINYIHTIPENAFTGLGALEYLNLAENQINEIHPNAFLSLKSLKDLNLGYNRIHHLPTAGLVSLEKLKVFHNPDLLEFPPKQEFPNVNNFVLSYAYHCCDFILSRPEQIYLDMFREHVVWMDAGEPGHMAMWARYENESRIWESLIENTTIENELWESFARNDYDLSNYRLGPAAATYLEDYQSQAYDHNYVIAKAAISCKPRPGPFMPCDDLFGWWSLRCGVWFVFMLALLGNGVVFFVSVTSKSKMDVPRFLICNLALADFFMGIYLGILAIMDASTLGQFKKYAIQWQMSAGCLVAGTLCVLSSELSVFTLTVITLERFYAITHAMQLSKRLSLKHAGIIMLCGWIWSFGLAILPLFGISDYRKFAVCLPFEIESVISKTYVCFIMVFNGISFFIILSCYMIMYISIRDSQAWNSNDTRVAKRMALLVFTDFFCWAPIAFLSLAAAFGKNLIHLNEAKVLTIFILPLNSCANPFLYAFFTKQFKKDCVLLCRRLEDSSIARHFSQASQRHVSMSWKYQRRPSGFQGLMGDNKSNNSQNNSTSSNSYGLLNYNSEISSRANMAAENVVLTSDKCAVYAIRSKSSSSSTCGGASGNKSSHRHTHKYKACPSGRTDDDNNVSYVKTGYTDVRSSDDDDHVILHQDFYSQSGTETNGCTVETYLNEDDDPTSVPSSQKSCDNFTTDFAISLKKDTFQCPSIVIHADDSTIVAEDMWAGNSPYYSDSEMRDRRWANDGGAYYNMEHPETVSCPEKKSNDAFHNENEDERKSGEHNREICSVNKSYTFDCGTQELTTMAVNDKHELTNYDARYSKTVIKEHNLCQNDIKKCLQAGVCDSNISLSNCNENVLYSKCASNCIELKNHVLDYSIIDQSSESKPSACMYASDVIKNGELHGRQNMENL